MLRIGIAAAVVAVAAAVVAFVVLPALRGPETATAAEMLASLNAAAGNAQVVSLSILEQRSPLVTSASPSSSPGQTQRTRPRTVSEQLTLGPSGDVRYTSVRELVDGAGTLVRTQLLETYDARRREMMRHGETQPVEGTSAAGQSAYGTPAEDGDRGASELGYHGVHDLPAGELPGALELAARDAC